MSNTAQREYPEWIRNAVANGKPTMRNESVSKDTQQEYRKWIKDAVASVADMDQDAVDDHFREIADASYWVIYTHAARQVLLWSSNEESAIDEYGWEMATKGIETLPQLYTRLAYHAVLDDLRDEYSWAV